MNPQIIFGLPTLKLSHNIVGFVLVGIPIYYMTQRTGPRDNTSLITGEYLSMPTIVARARSDKDVVVNAFVAICLDFFSRIRGRPTPGHGTGWQAVATDGDGDEQVEMAEQETRTRT